MSANLDSTALFAQLKARMPEAQLFPILMGLLASTHVVDAVGVADPVALLEHECNLARLDRGPVRLLELRQRHAREESRRPGAIVLCQLGAASVAFGRSAAMLDQLQVGTAFKSAGGVGRCLLSAEVLAVAQRISCLGARVGVVNLDRAGYTRRRWFQDGARVAA